MKAIITVIQLVGTAVALQVACSSTPSNGNNAGFSAEACKADTCGAEAKACSWGNNDPKYLSCRSDCDTLGVFNTSCPKQASALYACANLGANVDCTTGKGTGCVAEQQQLLTCVQGVDGGN
jgi:hypothetical protein